MLLRLLAAVVAASAWLWGAPALTTIQDTLFRADGTKFNGIVQITWTTFESGNTSFVAANSKTVRIVDGALVVKLVPTSGTNPAAYYTVRYWGSGKVQFTETWSVPETPLALRIRDVRTTGPLWPGGPIGSGGAAGNTEIQITDVVGLSDELDKRPAKVDPNLPAGVARIDASGKLAIVAGTANDCVQVSGSTTPCGSQVQFVDNETPNGVTITPTTVIFPAGVFAGSNGPNWNVDVKFTPTPLPVSGGTSNINVRLLSGANMPPTTARPPLARTLGGSNFSLTRRRTRSPAKPRKAAVRRKERR